MSIEPPPDPYVGLTPFDEAHASFFFGREQERRLLAASILAARLTLLYGQSGVGKSSLLRAGLVRDFREQARAALDRGRLPSTLFVVFGNWRDDPLPALAAAIESAVREQLGELAPEPPAADVGLDRLLLEWTRRLEERAAEVAPERRRRPHELLVVLDQFEEYFLYHGASDGDGTFALEFPRAVMRGDLRASFLIAIREDAYTQLDRFEGRIRNLFASNFRLEHLDERAARTAIEGPIARYNQLLTAGEETYAIEPELVDAVLRQVRAGSFALGQAGSGAVDGNGHGDGRVATPFLQLVMTRLWEEERDAGSRILRLATLERLGGAERLVRGHLEQALSDLTPSEQDLVAEAFAQLVTPSGTKIVHTQPDLAAYAHTTEDALAPALRTLTERRILRPVDPPPGETSPRFEIFHDVLAPAILDWQAWHEKKVEAARHRRARRRLALIAVGSLVLVALFGALAVWALAQKTQAADQKRAAEGQARVARSQALAASSVSQLDADPELALLLAIKAAEERKTPEAEAALRRAITESRLRGVFPTRGLAAAAVSPHGDRVVTVETSGAARLWRTTGVRRGVLLSAVGNTISASFDPSGRLVVTAGRDGTAHVVDAATGRTSRVLHAGARPLVAVRFADDGRRVLTVGRGGVARVWDAQTGTRLASASVAGPLAFFAFSPRSDTLRLAGRRGSQLVWAWQARDRPVRFRGPLGAVADDGRVILGSPAMFAGEPADTLFPIQILDPATRMARRIEVPGGAELVAFSPNGRLVATDGISDTVRVWNTRTGALLVVLPSAASTITDLSFSRDSRTIVTASLDGSARLWRATTGEQLAALRGPPGSTSAQFSADGRFVVSRNSDGAARLWLTQPSAAVATNLPHVYDSPPIATVRWTPSGALVLASGDGYAYVVDAGTGRLRRSINALTEPNGFVEFSPDGRLVVRADAVRDVATSRLRWRPPALLDTGAFRWDSKALAFVVRGGRVGTWEADDGNVRVLGKLGEVYDLGFDLDGDVLAERSLLPTLVFSRSGGPPRQSHHGVYSAVASDGSLAAQINGDVVHLWRGEQPAGTLAAHRREVEGVTFSPDGKRLATASDDGTARIWSLQRKTSIVLRGHVGPVDSVAFSPDGTLVATAGADGTVRVWQVDTGASVAVYRPSRQALYAAAFSPDGRLIATSGGDRVVSVIDCEPCRPFDELLTLARSRVTRQLTPQERRQFLGTK